MHRKFGTEIDMHTTWWNVKIRNLMEMLLMVFREQSEGDDQRTGTNLERARRILGMTTRQIFTEKRLVQMGTGHHEELTEEIDEAGIRKAVCY